MARLRWTDLMPPRVCMLIQKGYETKTGRPLLLFRSGVFLRLRLVLLLAELLEGLAGGVLGALLEGGLGVWLEGVLGGLFDRLGDWLRGRRLWGVPFGKLFVCVDMKNNEHETEPT